MSLTITLAPEEEAQLQQRAKESRQTVCRGNGREATGGQSLILMDTGPILASDLADHNRSVFDGSPLSIAA